MLDRVCTEILALEGDGRIGFYGDCGQWQAARARRRAAAESAAARVKPAASRPRSRSAGLSASEQKELKLMEATIAAAEEDVRRCTAAVENPDAAGDHVETQKRWQALEAARQRVDDLYARWEHLETRAARD
jgi:ATP-binding cassette subfamily F protein uup